MKTAYPNTQTTCSIRLYSNIPFDNSYANHPLISDKFKYNNSSVYLGIHTQVDANEGFINRKDYSATGNPYVYPRYDITGDFNFNFTNGLVGSVVLELTAEQTNANYLRLRVGSTNDYYYYFITSITQVNFETYQLSLELDVLMTYQSEFLDGMKDVPVFTSRKHSHRYTDDGLVPFSGDLKSGESTFASVNPSLIKNRTTFKFKDTQMKKLDGVMWLYVCVDDGLQAGWSNIINDRFLYHVKGIRYPLMMVCLPLGVKTLTYQAKDGTYSKSFDNVKLMNAIRQLINDGSVHGCKISPYPPFVVDGNTPTAVYPNITLDSSGNLTIASKVEYLGNDNAMPTYKMTIGNNILYYDKTDVLSESATTLDRLIAYGFIAVGEQNDVEYQLQDFPSSYLYVVNALAPNVTKNRYLDPKLYFAPFRKYYLTAQYSGQGNQFYPELVYSKSSISTNYNYTIYSVSTAYIGDNNFYTYLGSPNGAFNNYKYDKIGLASCVNYAFPCGENALDVFNSTQAQSFYQSKTASGVTSGLSILAGAGMTVGGIVLTATGGGSPMGIAMIGGGVTTMAGGIAGMVDTIKSTQAKEEDLRNTPDSVNISGSNFITDSAIAESNGLPYIMIYECDEVTKENANDFFYNFGYQVARECYFNTELKYDYTNPVDNNLFGRTIFNYIQLNEDITNKINANIPHLIKQKISAVFNKGITIWNFFGFDELWNVAIQTPSASYYLDRWFMKCTLDNTEYKGETFSS